MSLIDLINWLDICGLCFGVMFTVAVLMIGHWYPWSRPLSRIKRYVYGVASIVTGFTIWRFSFGVLAALAGLADWTIMLHELVIPAGLLGISVAGGITVVWAYQRDEKALRARQAKRAEELLRGVEESELE